jgi:hypothetical protein
MKRTLISVAATGMLCSVAWQLAAQDLPDPPAVLRIFREDIKQGMDAAHERSENAFMTEAARAKYPANIIGMTSITGPSQAWFLEAHDSFNAISTTLAAFDKPDADFAKLDALDGELRSGSTSWIAVYRPDLSFHGQELLQNLPKARFFNIDMIRIQPGHDHEFAELRHMVVDAAQRAISDQPVAVYQIVSGLPAGTYLSFEPITSLKTMDASDDRTREMYRAMGSTTTRRYVKAVADEITSQESRLFAINPKMSYVSKEFAAGDPNFWSPRTEEVKTPPKSGAKPAKKTASE